MNYYLALSDMKNYNPGINHVNAVILHIWNRKLPLSFAMLLKKKQSKQNKSNFVCSSSALWTHLHMFATN